MPPLPPRFVVQGKNSDQKPLALSLLANANCIDAQRQSPLYSTIPAELRDPIWRYALESFEDTERPFNPLQRYTRPGQAAKRRVAVELLLTCRAVYVETFTLPFAVNEMRIFDGDSLDYPPNKILQASINHPRPNVTGLGLSGELFPWQFAAINKVDLTVSQYMLEGGSLERTSRLMGGYKRHDENNNMFYCFSQAGYPMFKPPIQPKSEETPTSHEDAIYIAKPLTHLTIRMNRTDWWSWTDRPEAASQGPEKRLRLEPAINITEKGFNAHAMEEGERTRKEGKTPRFNLDSFEQEGRWGEHIREFWPDLQTLELRLETFAAKESQLDYVIQCAKLWTFNMDERSCLKWADPIDEMRWRGVDRYWYAREAAWTIEETTPPQRTTSRFFKSLISLGRDNDAKEPKLGQDFVVKTITYRRKAIPAAQRNAASRY